MASKDKTDELKLNQWSGDDYKKREDFNEDNKKIDDFAKETKEDIKQTKATVDTNKKDIDNRLSTTTKRLDKKIDESSNVYEKKINSEEEKVSKITFAESGIERRQIMNDLEFRTHSPIVRTMIEPELEGGDIISQADNIEEIYRITDDGRRTPINPATISGAVIHGDKTVEEELIAQKEELGKITKIIHLVEDNHISNVDNFESPNGTVQKVENGILVTKTGDQSKQLRILNNNIIDISKYSNDEVLLFIDLEYPSSAATYSWYRIYDRHGSSTVYYTNTPFLPNKLKIGEIISKSVEGLSGLVFTESCDKVLLKKWTVINLTKSFDAITIAMIKENIKINNGITKQLMQVLDGAKDTLNTETIFRLMILNSQNTIDIQKMLLDIS